jgi:hypothetical protein
VSTHEHALSSRERTLYSLGSMEGLMETDHCQAAQRRQPPVVGHADWEEPNLRWVDRRLHVVHDWDSVVSRPEAALAGVAAAVYPVCGGPGTATLEESAAFLRVYEQVRGQPWSVDEW